MTNKEKFPLYIDQLLTKGNKEIERLSKFDTHITIEHADEIRKFQLQEFEKINSCKTLLIYPIGNSFESDKVNLLQEKLDFYHNKIQFFAQDFPIEE